MGAGASAESAVGTATAIKGATAEELVATIHTSDPKVLEKLELALYAAKNSGQEARLLLVSDNLPRYEQIMTAAKDTIQLVPIKYLSWTLEDLKQAIISRAGEPAKQYASVGLLDHGSPGHFCLLANVGGGSIDVGDFENDSGKDILAFFKWLAGYVKAPNDLHKWQEDLTARIDLMGCCVAAGEEGAALLRFLEEETKVNWAASTNKTGAGEGADGGFDWVMESDSGLGCIADCYFHKEKIAKWQYTAGFWDGLAVVGAGTVGFCVGGPAGAALGAGAAGASIGR